MAKLKSGTRIYGTATVDSTLNASSGPILVGSALSTGTQSQPLQVNGGVYVSDNLGVGITNPTTKLYISGDTYITGILTANRIISSVYGEFTGGSISGTNIVGTSLSVSGISTTLILNVGSGGTVITTTSNGLVGIGSTNPTSKLDVSGNIVASGTITANSDEQLKTNVQTISNALEKVLLLRGVEYDRIDNGDHQIGVIAQEVEEIIPDVVYPKHPYPEYQVKSVAYGNLIALLIEAIKEQNIEIQKLKKRLGDI